jgi:hypothetical protein
MPELRRAALPEAVLRHLARRMREREITADHLAPLVRWLDTHPAVPDGRWFKRFPGMILCGQGELPQTFLTPGQVPEGIEIG